MQKEENLRRLNYSAKNVSNFGIFPTPVKQLQVELGLEEGKSYKLYTQSVWLKSGDVVVMPAEARLRYHGIDRVKFGSSDLLERHGRINITLRVVT